MAKHRINTPSYPIGPLDRIMIGDEEVRLLMDADTGKVFERVNGIATPIVLSNKDIAAMIGEGQLSVEKRYYDVKRLERFNKNPFLRDMPEHKRDEIAFKLEWVTRVEEKREELGRISTDTIGKGIAENYKAELTAARRCADPSRQFTFKDEQFNLSIPNGRTLRDWTKKVRDADGDWRALVDHRGTGLRVSKFTCEELDIQGRFVMRFLSDTEPSPAYLFRLMKAFERRINRIRVEDNRPTINLGGRTLFYERIAALPSFAKCVARKGDKKAIHKYAIVQGAETGYPMHRVQADECRLDLVTILKNAKVWKDLSAAEQEAYAEASKRFWLSAVVDRATMCFLSLRLHEKDPSIDTALACFELTTRDKTDIARNAGCKGTWPHCGGLIEVVVDCATWYTSPRFTATMTDAGVTKMHPPAGLSFLRGTIERVFQIIGALTLQNFSGRTFSSIVKRGDHDPKAGASVDREMLQNVVIRAVVDVHHNSRNTGNLAGMSPNHGWYLWAQKRKPPRPPEGFLKRHIYGMNLKRVIQPEGIFVLGFRFQSDEIQAMRRNETGVEVDIRVDLQDMGEITVFHGRLTYRVPSALGLLRGRSYWHLTALLQEMKLIDNDYTDRTQKDVDDALEFIDNVADIGRFLRGLANPITTWEHIERVERRIRRPLQITKTSEFTREVAAQDWSRTEFLDAAWGLSDETDEDDLDVPRGMSKAAVEAKYRVEKPIKAEVSAKTPKPAAKGRAAADKTERPSEPKADEKPLANYRDEF